MPKYVNRELNKFIKQRRLKADVTQLELAQVFKPVVTPQHICNMENGAAPVPLEHFSKIAKKINVTLEQMVKLHKQDLANEVDAFFKTKLK